MMALWCVLAWAGGMIVGAVLGYAGQRLFWRWQVNRLQKLYEAGKLLRVYDKRHTPPQSMRWELEIDEFHAEPAPYPPKSPERGSRLDPDGSYEENR